VQQVKWVVRKTVHVFCFLFPFVIQASTPVN